MKEIVFWLIGVVSGAALSISSQVGRSTPPLLFYIWVQGGVAVVLLAGIGIYALGKRAGSKPMDSRPEENR